MANTINKVSQNLWIGREDYGYAPHFYNTRHLRGKGLSTGFGHYDIMEDVLNPPSKSVKLDWHNSPTFYNAAYGSFSAGTHGDFIDMRVNSVHNRQTLTRFAQFIMLPIVLIIYFFVRIARNDIDWGELHIAEVFMFGFVFILFFIDFIRPIATPVRFNYTKQELYVYHKKALYRIPWNECQIASMYAPDHVGYGGYADAYNLNLWLYPKHCVNGKAGTEPISLILVHSVQDHADVYIYWEYIRRYMANGIDAVLHEDREEKMVLLFPHPNWSFKKRMIAWLCYPLFIVLLPFISPSIFAIRYNPLKSRWPQQVHEWTGRKVDWH